MPLPPAALATPYGADENGIICAYLFDGSGPAQGIGAQALLELRSNGLPAGAGFVWLHLNLSHAHAEHWLREHGGLPDDFFDAIREGSRSSRIERDGDTLFAIVNDATFDFSFDPSDIATLWISVRDRWVVSARRQPLRSVDRLRAAVKRGELIDSSVALLDHLLRDASDELQHL